MTAEEALAHAVENLVGLSESVKKDLGHISAYEPKIYLVLCALAMENQRRLSHYEALEGRVSALEVAEERKSW